MPTAISLFSGAMGLDLGLERAGITTKLAVEIDRHCCRTIGQNRPTVDVWETDIRQVNAKSLLKKVRNPTDVFLMVGGPPCQSFCPGGKRAALSDPRGNLIYVYLRLIQDVQPRFFVLENVANLVTAALRHRPISERPGKHWNLSVYDRKNGEPGDGVAPMEPDELSGTAIRQVVEDVRRMGYGITLSVVDAADFGAPQHRLRFLMFGARDSSAPTIVSPTHGENSSSRERLQTVRDAIYDLTYNPGPHSEYTDKVAKYFAMIPPGGNWRDLPKTIQREALGDASFEAGGGKTGFFRRLSWDRPSPTITGRANRKGSALCHPDAIRPLSVRECARLQGFPDDWQFTGAMNRQYMQVGNAVPVHLGIAIGRTLLEKGSSEPSNREDDLDLALEKAIARLRASARNKRGKKIQQPSLF
ncbi:MAG TPA: DNA cytosine methyltransferase [Pirellulales bacterium]|nr:DNA cytosine methyltransferase [Pirellulales bacterium]